MSLKHQLRPLVRKLEPYAWFELRRRGYLRDVGWFRSFRDDASVDASGQAIPWLTYPAIRLISDRLTADLRLFEYGCGNSTRWWAERVATVRSVEHHPGWHAKISSTLPPNATVALASVEGGQYARAILDAQGPFDLVLIDGRDRVACAEHAVEALSDHGVILWDDAQRDRYRPGIEALLAAGFRELPLEGLAPILVGRKTTSILYRPLNCLGI